MMAEPLFTSITGVSWLVSLQPFLILEWLFCSRISLTFNKLNDSQQS